MIEDLLDETRFLSLSHERQTETIREHCRGVVEKIRQAPDASRALEIVHKACDNFDNACPSRIIRGSLRDHLIRIYDETWKGRKLGG